MIQLIPSPRKRYYTGSPAFRLPRRSRECDNIDEREHLRLKHLRALPPYPISCSCLSYHRPSPPASSPCSPFLRLWRCLLALHQFQLYSTTQPTCTFTLHPGLLRLLLCFMPSSPCRARLHAYTPCMPTCARCADGIVSQASVNSRKAPMPLRAVIPRWRAATATAAAGARAMQDTRP